MAKKILIIDDDANFAEATSALLKSRGYEVLWAQDGQSGLSVAKKDRPDIMLLDVMMTYDSEGLDMAKKFKESQETKDIPVIMVTGIRRAMNLNFSFESDDEFLPVKAVLEKPVKPEVLLEAIAKVIG
jgi:CheY-like chemotaxis protein